MAISRNERRHSYSSRPSIHIFSHFTRQRSEDQPKVMRECHQRTGYVHVRVGVHQTGRKAPGHVHGRLPIRLLLPVRRQREQRRGGPGARAAYFVHDDVHRTTTFVTAAAAEAAPQAAAAARQAATRQARREHELIQHLCSRLSAEKFYAYLSDAHFAHTDHHQEALNDQENVQAFG